jgi:hypothetical protein
VCTVTFYLSPRVLYDHVALLAHAVVDAPSLEGASAVLNALGVRTEYAFEQEMLRRGAQRYDQT